MTPIYNCLVLDVTTRLHGRKGERAREQLATLITSRVAVPLTNTIFHIVVSTSLAIFHDRKQFTETQHSPSYEKSCLPSILA